MGLYKIGRISTAGLIVAGLLCAGLWECGLGWAQLLGFAPSLHSLYPATGSFYNPGPFCGFLAVILPVALCSVLSGRPGCLYWMGVLYLVAAAGIMPALMGRTGWIAAAAGCALAAGGCGRLPRLRPKAWLLLVLGAAAVAAFLIRLKPASALGRLLLWRTGLDAVLARPLSGSGWDRVAGALGEAQEAYFTAAPDSVFAGVAGTPEYAFNEFLQVGIAFGIPAMALFTAVLAAATVAAWRGGAYGIAGGLVAFATVCLSSYPLQFPEFIAAVSAMIAGAVSVSGLRGPVKAAAGLCLICGAAAACHHQIKRNDESDRWRQQRYICRYRLEPRQIHRLDSLYGMYSHSAEFLFDYGKALRETKLYEKSTAVLSDGLAVSSDPMFLNLMGRNHHDLGQYAEAECCFRRSIHRLPGRIYPHYLLCLLYADPNVSDTARFNSAYAETLTMEPKVMSPAIRQMRRELKALSVRLSPAKVGGHEDFENNGNNHDEESQNIR